MKIGIIGANGKAGSRIAKVALDKGYQVTAIVRDVAKTDIRPVIEKSILELTKEELAQFDIVVSAFGISNPD
ncbi:MAG TPA: NADH-flavin reductase, partial [Lysinibacillus sp.]|nr:NADH-flavin reductase [Lysinibacillus sp.]